MTNFGKISLDLENFRFGNPNYNFTTSTLLLFTIIMLLPFCS